MKKLYNRLTTLLLLIAGSILPSAADTWEYEFTDNVFADGNTATLNGVEWTLEGKAVKYTSSIDPFYTGQGFSTNSTILRCEYFKSCKINKMTVYTWAHDNAHMVITDDTRNIFKTDDGTGANSNLYSPTAENAILNACYIYTPTGTDNEVKNLLKIVYNKTYSNTNILLKKLVIEYEPAPKPIPFAFRINGEDAVSGTATEPGAVLTLSTPGVENPLVVYKVNQEQSDAIYDATSGITLSDSGNFIYHFTATADGWLDTDVDFSVTVSGGAVDTNSTDFASAAEDFGLTVFSPESEEYETNHRWWTDQDVEYFFEKGEKIRLESSEENGTVLSFAPEATLQIGVEQDPEAHIVSVDIEGPNADAFVISRKGEGPGSQQALPRHKRAAKQWNSGADRITTIEVYNSSPDTHAGIAKVNVEIAHDKLTEVDLPYSENSVGEPTLYDLSGRRVTTDSPAPGIYIRVTGSKAEKIAITR